ncbi:hypothetical protein [Bailinhaonella thermotolerans]|uniref:Uncharacterized protein n=1 Tax=Bailinhaonella thermotolerans TaxID=1070861 RepID=A0A3A4B3T9_9ACTN|nr:hypothetical protein [Bailinhaonella thermotolerans]RJL32040.1 hypothetical protein D5H75_16545 [Bailinhaonella thermotolerans]
MSTRIPCFGCGARFAAEEYFGSCHDYDRGRDCLAWTCPRCGNRDDLRILPDGIGYGHPRGQAFAVQDTYPVPGLRRLRHDLRLEIVLDRRLWEVPATRAPRDLLTVPPA